MERNTRTTGPACVTCREKCRRCDRTRPVCRRCASKGLECKGYPDRFRFCGVASRGKWRNQGAPVAHHALSGPQTRQRREAASRQARRDVSEDQHHCQTPRSSHPPDTTTTWMVEAAPPQESNHIWHQPDSRTRYRTVELDDLLMLDRTESLLAHYDYRICPHQIALPQDGAENPYRTYVLPLVYEQIGVLYAVLGLTACHKGIMTGDDYLQGTVAVEYRMKAIRSLGEFIQNGIYADFSEDERDGIFATVQILLLQDIFESGVSSHGVHITGALSICIQLRLHETLRREDERVIFFLGNLTWLDIIRSLANPKRLCFNSELRETIIKLSDGKLEQVNGCPRALLLMMGNILEHAKAHATKQMDDAQYEALLEDARYRLYSWNSTSASYPDDNPRWLAVAEAFRHACILHTSRLLDAAQPAEAPVIQQSVTAILDAAAEIPSDCYLLELLVMPLFMAGTDTLSAHSRHYILLRLDQIKSKAGFGNPLPNSLLGSVWKARGNQPKKEHTNIPWMQFVSGGNEKASPCCVANGHRLRK